MRPSEFDVQTSREDGRLVVAPVGELDIATVDRLRDAVAARGDGEALVVDLAGLEFLDTSGLQLMVALHRRARDEGYELTIVRGPHEVQRVFEIAGLDGVLPFADTRP